MAAKAAPHAEDPDAISTAVTDLLLHWLHRPELVRTQAELALEAARRPELMDVFDPWRQGLVRVVEELVRCAGRDDPAAARRGRVWPPSRACSHQPSGCRPPAGPRSSAPRCPSSSAACTSPGERHAVPRRCVERPGAAPSMAVR